MQIKYVCKEYKTVWISVSQNVYIGKQNILISKKIKKQTFVFAQWYTYLRQKKLYTKATIYWSSLLYRVSFINGLKVFAYYS